MNKKQFYLEKISGFCDKCGTRYTEQNITIVSDDGTQAIIHFKCHDCLSEHFANYIENIGSSSKMPIVSDMQSDEVVKFLSLGAVSADDVIKIYQSSGAI